MQANNLINQEVNLDNPFAIKVKTYGDIKTFSFDLTKEIIDHIQNDNQKYNYRFQKFVNCEPNHPYPFFLAPDAYSYIVTYVMPNLCSQIKKHVDIEISDWRDLSLDRILEKVLVPTGFEPVVDNARTLVDRISERFANNELINIVEFSTGAGLNTRAISEFLLLKHLNNKCVIDSIDMTPAAAIMGAMNLLISRKDNGENNFDFRIIIGSELPIELASKIGVNFRISKSEEALASDVIAGRDIQVFNGSNARIYYPININQKIDEAIIQLSRKHGAIIQEEGLENTSSIELRLSHLFELLLFGSRKKDPISGEEISMLNWFKETNEPYPWLTMQIKNGREIDHFPAVHTLQGGKVYDVAHDTAKNDTLPMFLHHIPNGIFVKWLKTLSSVSSLTVDLQNAIKSPIIEIFNAFQEQINNKECNYEILRTPGVRKVMINDEKISREHLAKLGVLVPDNYQGEIDEVFLKANCVRKISDTEGNECIWKPEIFRGFTIYLNPIN